MCIKTHRCHLISAGSHPSGLQQASVLIGFSMCFPTDTLVRVRTVFKTRAENWRWRAKTSGRCEADGHHNCGNQLTTRCHSSLSNGSCEGADTNVTLPVFPTFIGFAQKVVRKVTALFCHFLDSTRPVEKSLKPKLAIGLEKPYTEVPW